MFFAFPTLFLADFAETKIRKKRANGRNSEAADFLAFEGYRFSELQRESLTFSRYENNLRLDLAGCPPRK